MLRYFEIVVVILKCIHKIIISHWVFVYHRIAFMRNSTNSWLFYLIWAVSITQIVLMLSSLWTANSIVVVYCLWYTSLAMCLYIFKWLRTENTAYFCLFRLCVLKVYSDSYFLINLPVLLHVMESFRLCNGATNPPWVS